MPDGTLLDWESFSRLQWRINGLKYEVSIAELFARAVKLLSPVALARYGGVVAHGDAHNANIFASKDGANSSLSLRYFDPAFAGRNMPALLAEVKATFHNTFAHPFWLYEPDRAESAFTVSAHQEAGLLVVEHNWQVSPIRTGILTSKVEQIWLPLLQALRERKFLQSPEDMTQACRQLVLHCFVVRLWSCPCGRMHPVAWARCRMQLLPFWAGQSRYQQQKPVSKKSRAKQLIIRLPNSAPHLEQLWARGYKELIPLGVCFTD